jgi:crossover junction endodeoxyribonuclease RuvC
MRVLAIDPALRNTGFAVLDYSEQGKHHALAFGVIRNKQSLSQSGCLVAIREQLRDVIQEHRPDCCAIESVIFVQSYKTAITLGAARGAAMIAAAEQGIAIHEYPPRRVKQAVVGRGAADKEQVCFMVRALLGLTETPPHDAADALAIGITHFQASDPARSAAMGEVKTI